MTRSNKHTKGGLVSFLKIVLCMAAVVALSGAVLFGIWMMDNRLPAFQIQNAAAAYVKVADTTTMEGLLQQVDEHLHPKWPSSVRRTLRKEMSTHELVPGFYRFTNTNSAIYFSRSVTRGWQSPLEITISGSIRTLDTLSAKVSAQMLVSKKELMTALNDRKIMDRYGVKSPAYWFYHVLPDTYQMYWSASAEEIIQRLCQETDKFWTPERKALAKAQGITPEQAVVLSSIVAEETASPQEYAKIASVYLNRLRVGMKLQSDPTINYIYGFTLRRILLRHLQTESPYNTYQHEGLPPTPICMPSKAHIEAVLHPDATKYLYFCASPKLNGRHLFATSYSEHMKNANAFHHALDSLASARRLTAAQASEAKEEGNE